MKHENFIKFQDIAKTEGDIHHYCIKDDVLRSISIDMTNLSELKMECDNCTIFESVYIGPWMSSVLNILIGFFKTSENDITKYSDIKNIPIKVLYKDNAVVGFGTKDTDEYLLLKDILFAADKDSEANSALAREERRRGNSSMVWYEYDISGPEQGSVLLPEDATNDEIISAIADNLYYFYYEARKKQED